MKRKILFIINPISGIGKSKTAEQLIKQKLDKSVFDFEIAYTKEYKHAIELSKQGVKENFEIITAVGGDGSINEVGRSLIGTSTSLAILPAGSGNGIAGELKIPINIAKALETINRGKFVSIDTFFVNKEIAINVAGVGYAAYIAHKFSKLKKRGFSNYIKIAIQDSIKYKSQECEIQFNDPETKKEYKTNLNAFIIDIANGTQWGNNAVIAPEAKYNDGLLNLCMVRSFPFLLFPVMAIRLFTNSINASGYVDTRKITEAIIRQEHTYAHIDGEPLLLGNELRIKINPQSLKVIVP